MYTCTCVHVCNYKLYMYKNVYCNSTLYIYIHLFHFSSFEEEVYNEWVSGVDEVAKTNLEKPLLVWEKKESMELVKVNFDPKVQCTCKCHTMYTIQTMFIYTMYMYTECIYMYMYMYVHKCTFYVYLWY